MKLLINKIKNNKTNIFIFIFIILIIVINIVMINKLDQKVILLDIDLNDFFASFINWTINDFSNVVFINIRS